MNKQCVGKKETQDVQLPTLLLSGMWSFVSRLIQAEGDFHSPEALIQMMPLTRVHSPWQGMVLPQIHLQGLVLTLI